MNGLAVAGGGTVLPLFGAWVAWVCGVDGPDRVDEDLDATAELLLGE